MNKLENLVCGKWMAPEGDGIPQYDAVTGDVISICGSEGIDFVEMANYARAIGNENLRKMTFQERGMMLKKLAMFLHKRRHDYYPLSYRTGATKVDS